MAITLITLVLSSQMEVMPPMSQLTWSLNDTYDSHSFPYPFNYSLNKFLLNTYYGTIFVYSIDQTDKFPVLLAFTFRQEARIKWSE